VRLKQVSFGVALDQATVDQAIRQYRQRFRGA